MSAIIEKLSLRVRRYLSDLTSALLGSGRFQKRLDELNMLQQKSEENLKSLQDQYYSALEKWDQQTRLLEESESTKEALMERLREKSDAIDGFAKRLSAAQDELDGRDKLVENLRERVREKEAELKRQGEDYHERMERMKADYQKRIDEYNLVVDEMKRELAGKAKRPKSPSRAVKKKPAKKD